jgi:hypothetical protein
MSESEGSEAKKPLEVAVKLPVKDKKPRTPAQVAAQQKAFSVLKQRREEKAKAEAELKEGEALAKTKWKEVKKKVPEYVTKKDLEDFMTTLSSKISVPAPPVMPEPKVIEKIVEKPVERIVERVVEKPPPAKKMTGHELLDTLFALK